MKKNWVILAIDTSCDETSAAVTVGRRVFSNVVSSQVELHRKYGGVVPIIAQRAHQERIEAVVNETLKRALTRAKQLDFQPLLTPYPELSSGYLDLTGWSKRMVDTVAVTVGPGLAPALEVGVAKAKELALKYKKPLIAVNHMEGHLLSSFALNSKGNFHKISQNIKYLHEENFSCRYLRKSDKTVFPLIGLLVSGGHTQLVLMKHFGEYQLLGETLDDAGGEAFDKIARMLNLGYPGGPIVERLAKEGDENKYDLPVPMHQSNDLDFSFSGLKTAVLYLIRDLKDGKISGSGNFVHKKQIVDVCASFQKATAGHLAQKLEMAVKIYRPKGILLGGGVISNLYLRAKIRQVMKKQGLPIYIPYSKILLTDNAAMIGIAAYYKALRGEFVKNIKRLDRKPNLSL